MRVILVDAHKVNSQCTGHQLYKALVGMDNEVMHLDFRQDSNYINSRIQDEHNIDLLIAWKGSSLDPKVIKGLSYPTVLWYPDDLTMAHSQIDIMNLGRAFNFVYTPIQENIDEYKYRYGINAKFLPCGIDTELYRFMPDVEKKYNFSFVGSLNNSIYKERIEVLTRLAGLTDKFFIGNAYGEDYVKIINQTKININIGLNWRGTQLRIFEVLACGGKLFTNKTEYSIYLPNTITFNIHNIEKEFDTALTNWDKNMNAPLDVDWNHQWENRFRDMFMDIGVAKADFVWAELSNV